MSNLFDTSDLPQHAQDDHTPSREEPLTWLPDAVQQRMRMTRRQGHNLSPYMWLLMLYPRIG